MRSIKNIIVLYLFLYQIHNNTLEIDVFEDGKELTGETISAANINVTEHIKEYIDSLIVDEIISIK